MKDVLVDLAPGALVGARAEQEGIAAVLMELAQVIPVHGENAEIRVAVHNRVVAATVNLEKPCAHEIVLKRSLLRILRLFGDHRT